MDPHDGHEIACFAARPFSLSLAHRTGQSFRVGIHARLALACTFLSSRKHVLIIRDACCMTARPTNAFSPSGPYTCLRAESVAHGTTGNSQRCRAWTFFRPDALRHDARSFASIVLRHKVLLFFCFEDHSKHTIPKHFSGKWTRIFLEYGTIHMRHRFICLQVACAGLDVIPRPTSVCALALCLGVQCQIDFSWRFAVFAACGPCPCCFARDGA